MNSLHPAVKKAVKKKRPRGWELDFARRSFFRRWRSVLTSKLPVRIFPLAPMLSLRELVENRNKQVAEGICLRRTILVFGEELRNLVAINPVPESYLALLHWLS